MNKINSANKGNVLKACRDGRETSERGVILSTKGQTLSKTESMWKGENKGETRERVFNSLLICKDLTKYLILF